jgi:hypothetical protein
MTNAQAENFATLPADAHDPRDDRPTIDTPEDFNREFADQLRWEREVYGFQGSNSIGGITGGDPATRF